MDFSLKQYSADYYKRLPGTASVSEYTADAVVPDTQEDIARIIGVTGCAKVRSKDARAGTAMLTGEVSACVMYVPESGQGVSVLNVAVPFTAEQPFAGGDDALPVSSVRLTSLSAGMLNPRKVLVKAELGSTSDVYVKSVLNWYGEPEDGRENGLRVRCAQTGVMLPAAVVEKSFVVSDELQLPAGKPAPDKLLAAGAEVRITETQNVGGKLIMKGVVRTEMFYAPSDGGMPEYAAAETQFSQLMETAGGEAFEITPMLTDAYIELVTSGSGEAAVSLEAHIVAQTVCMTNVDISYISDAYCVRSPLSVQRESICAQSEVSCEALHAAARAQFEFQRPCAAVVGTQAWTGRMTGSAAAELIISVMYQADDGLLYADAFRMTVETECPEGCVCTAVAVTDLAAIPAGMSVEVRVQADFTVRRAASMEISAVVAAQTDDDAPIGRRPSVTVVRAETDDLWLIAKKYRSDADDIAACNGIEGQDITAGMILLIP